MCNLNKGRYIASMSICKGTEIFVNRKRFKRERERERERERVEREIYTEKPSTFLTEDNESTKFCK